MTLRLALDDLQEDTPNLTPLIDVVFLLLVFFLVATTFAGDEVELDLELPRSGQGSAAESAPLLVIQVRDDGSLYVDGRAVSLDGLRQRLRAEAGRDAGREVLIRGDGRVQLARVVAAFDACLEASLHKVSIAAQPLDARSGRGG